jgi:uncharacterized coiled-coil DUF342 family protein
MLRKFTSMKDKALKIKSKLTKKTGVQVNGGTPHARKNESPEFSGKQKKREIKATQKTAAKKSVVFNEQENEVVKEISGVERKWNDYKGMKSQLVQGKFQPDEIKALMNAICEYVKLNNLGVEGL